jgi:hypothetical protein
VLGELDASKKDNLMAAEPGPEIEDETETFVSLETDGGEEVECFVIYDRADPQRLFLDFNAFDEFAPCPSATE